jgi:hypothetical protein
VQRVVISLDWNSVDVIRHDNPSFFYWGYNYNIDWKYNLWVADKTNHTIFYISKEKETWNAIFKVAGVENVAGARDGNIAKATFNGPQSLCVYNYNHTAVKFDLYMRPVYLLDKMRNDILCKNKNYNFKNYTKCAYAMEDDFPYSIVDHARVQYIPFVETTPEDFNKTRNYTEQGDFREVYIADTENHCIRKLTILQANIETVAGICGRPGFQDGIYLTNQLNRPEMVGIDA